MSLYTPVFPSFHESNTSRKGHPENTLEAPPGKQRNYVEFLRDVHLFLSTQSDMLSPPSRPNSPLFDHRVQKVRDEIQDVIGATEGETSSGKWTRVSQTLKLGCVRGRHWSVSGAGSCAPEEDTNWILPDEESEWVEWEKKREENRRLKGKTNVSQQIDTAAPTPDSQKISQANFANQLTRAYNVRGRPPRDVSPTTLRAAKEKVRKWQASMTSEMWRNTTNGSSPASASTGAVVAAATTKGKTERPQRSRTLDFAVVKPAAKSIIDKRGKGGSAPVFSHQSKSSTPLKAVNVLEGEAPVGVDETGSKQLPKAPPVKDDIPKTTDVPGSGSAPMPSHKSKSSTLSKAVNVPEVKTPVDVDETGSNQPPKASPVKGDMPKIADVPETPYLPPSFPAHLETSTPPTDSVIIIRAKPSPILPLPALSSTPLPSTCACADPPDERQFIITEPHVANVSSSQPPQINTVQPGKRSRALSTSLDSIPNDAPVTPPAKRLRTLSLNRSTPSSKPSKLMSPNEGLGTVPCIRDEARDPSLGSAPSQRDNTGTVGIVSGAPLTPGKNDQPPTGADALGFLEKIPSPTKSVKSYFSAPDSDPADSPLKANLLLESPVSPMLSYAQNPSGFLPQFTSTQVGKGSPSVGRTNHGIFGIGYSSQFDVERHVDRVSELLEKDVDFDGWLRDARTLETSQD